MPCIAGKRISLRPYALDDYTAIESWQNDDAVTHYLSTRYWIPQSSGDCEAYLQGRMQSSHNAYYFVIADKSNDEYLGQVDLYGLDWRLRCATLGIVVIRPGCGYGQEALRLIRRYAFDTLGLERIEIEVHEQNLPALRCYEKAGFCREGVKRKAYYSDGAFHDVILMSAIREDEAPGD